jgi:hypothetical protein
MLKPSFKFKLQDLSVLNFDSNELALLNTEADKTVSINNSNNSNKNVSVDTRWRKKAPGAFSLKQRSQEQIEAELVDLLLGTNSIADGSNSGLTIDGNAVTLVL